MSADQAQWAPYTPAATRVRYDAERDTWHAHRSARVWPAALNPRIHQIEQAPEISEPEPTSKWATLAPLLGSLGFVMMAVVLRNPMYAVLAVVMGLVAVISTQGSRMVARDRSVQRRGQLRRAYAWHLDTARVRAQGDLQHQRDALLGLYPDTAGTLRMARELGALWERRPSDPDFGQVRLGLGRVPATCPIVLSEAQSALGTQREPDLAAEATAAVAHASVLEAAPVVLPLRTASSIAVVGDLARSRALAASWVASLSASCAPTDLRFIGLIPAQALPIWEWTKWLPHTRDPLAGDGFARAIRGINSDPRRFADAIGHLASSRQEQFRRATAAQTPGAAGAAKVAGEHVVVIVDGHEAHGASGQIATLETLVEQGIDLGVTVILLVANAADIPTTTGTRIDVFDDGTLQVRESGPNAVVTAGVVADVVDLGAAQELARLMAPLQLADADAAADLVDTVRLIDLLGVDHADALDQVPPVPSEHDLMSTPVGITSDGNPLVLDLKEAAAGGMGPHGILVGATGTGKSELLRSLVAGLTARHTPDLFTTLLVDYKGGAAFAGLEKLPHVAGMVTNISDDPTLIGRVQASLEGELQRRQRLLKDYECESVRVYQDQRAEHPEWPELPYLFVVVDEFGELLEINPDFLDVLVAIGRLGRSLGIHLLLATQRLDSGRIRGLESHLRYRLCLRTFSAAESTAVIGSPAAHHLPSLPGVGYLSLDAGLRRFKAATTSTPHRPGLSPAEQLDDQVPVRPFTLSGTDDEAPTATSVHDGTTITELKALVARLLSAQISATRQIWLPPLPTAITRDELPPLPGPAPANPWQRVVVGLYDDPAHQAQNHLALDLTGSGGHVAVVGAPRTGKSTFLRTLADAIATSVAPYQAAIYVLDLTGGGLNDLTSWSHVGAVAGRQDPEAVARLLREMHAVIEERAEAMRLAGVASMSALRESERGRQVLPGGLAAEIFLMIDGAGTLRTEYPELDMQLADLATHCLQYGIHIVLTASRWLDIRPALLEAIGSRFELRLNDPVDSLVGRAAAAALPMDRPGRGLMRDARTLQLALPGPRSAHVVDGSTVPRIVPLPSRIRTGEVAAFSAQSGRPAVVRPGLLLGVGEFRLTPEYLDLSQPGSHFLMFGDDGSGRTSLLRRLVTQLGSQPDVTRVHLVDLSRSMLDLSDLPGIGTYAFTSSQVGTLSTTLMATLLERLPPPNLTRQQLIDRSWWSGPDHILVIDDYDLTLSGAQGPLTPLADAIGHARDIGFHIVLARRVAGAGRSVFESFGQRVRELATSYLILDGERSEGPLVADKYAIRRPPGRGLLIRKGQAETVIQLALADETPGPRIDLDAATASETVDSTDSGRAIWAPIAPE